MEITLKKPRRFVWSVMAIIFGVVLVAGCAPLYEKAEVAIESGDFTEAISIYEKIIRNKKQDATTRAKALTAQGYALVQLHKRDEALERFNRAINLDNSFSLPAILKSEILIAQEEYSEAIRILSELVKTKPSLAAYENLGQAHFALNQIEDAVSAYKEALRFPAEPEIRAKLLSNIARCWFLMERWNEAQGAVLRIQKDLRIDKDWLLLVLSSYELKDYYAARQSLKRLHIKVRIAVIKNLDDTRLVTQDVILTK